MIDTTQLFKNEYQSLIAVQKIGFGMINRTTDVNDGAAQGPLYTTRGGRPVVIGSTKDKGDRDVEYGPIKKEQFGMDGLCHFYLREAVHDSDYRAI
jgi:hypothetical protein